MHNLFTLAPRESDCSSNDDAALIQAARTNPTAFGELYKRYLSRVYGYIRSRLPNDEEAADVTAQVFLKAWHAFPRYQDRGFPFVSWLFRIARNALTDVHRGQRPLLSWESLSELSHPVDPDGPEDQALRKEAHARVRALVANLEPGKQEVLLLRFAAGLTLREIACVIGKSESAVHKQLVQTLSLLKEQFHD